jgi:hypothetical protein
MGGRHLVSMSSKSGYSETTDLSLLPVVSFSLLLISSMYEMFTGKLMFPGGHNNEMLRYAVVYIYICAHTPCDNSHTARALATTPG